MRLSLLLLFSGLSLACASSSGDVAHCKLLEDVWGCSKFKEPESSTRNNEDSCEEGKKTMFWVDKPVESDKYAIRAGNGLPADDATTYSPGELVNLYIKVADKEHKYRGIAVQGLNSKDELVGEWEYPVDEKNLFWTPPKCAKTAIHTSAAVKPFTALVRFRAPAAAGTGAIKFIALIKVGPANRGKFFHPPPLTLQEKAKHPGFWGLAKAGESCSAMCSANNMQCNAAHMKNVQLSNGKSFLKEVGASVACANPAFKAACTNTIAPAATQGGTCFYREESCALDCSTTSTKAEDGGRLCFCGTAPPTTTTATAPTPDDDELNSSPRSRAFNPLVMMLLLLLPAAQSRHGAVFVMLAILGMCSSAQAHNWIFSEARAQGKAMVSHPCPSGVKGRFHVQMGPDQTFAFAWSGGHPSGVGKDPMYLAVIHADDYYRIPTNSRSWRSILQTYVKEAPDGSNFALERKWQRVTAVRGQPTSIRNLGSTPWQQVLIDNITQTRNKDLWAPSQYLSTPGFHRDAAKFKYFRVNETRLAGDRRVAYKNSNYPWIVSAHTISNTEDLPFDFHQIQMGIDKSNPIGHYIMIYAWRGYSDCVDVEFRSQTVTHKYGKIPTAGGVTTCATEGQTCTCTGEVTYGNEAEKKISDPRKVTGSIECSNSEFGDPAPGLPKSCICVKEGTSVDPSKSGKYVWNRIEHCVHETPKRLTTTCRVADTAEGCKADLSDGWTPNDNIAINAMPMANPAMVHPSQGKYPTVYNNTDCGAGDALRIEGKDTQSDDATWEAKFMATAEKMEDTTCVRAISNRDTSFGKPNTLKDAVLACSQKGCIGIAKHPTTGIYLGCEYRETGTKTAKGYTTYLKKDIGVPEPTSNKMSSIQDFYHKNQWEHTAVIAFAAPSTASNGKRTFKFHDASKTVHYDQGEVYGDRGNGLNYGWTNCKHTLFAINTNIPSLSKASEPCGCDFSQQKSDFLATLKTDGWSYDAPAPCKRNQWEMKVDNGWYHVYGQKARFFQATTRGCAFEGKSVGNVKVADKNASATFETFVHVTDGKLTFEDMGLSNKPRTGSGAWECDFIHYIAFEKQKAGGPAPGEVWYPKSDSPWRQIELPEKTAVGVVSLKLPKSTDCAMGLLFSKDATCLADSYRNGGAHQPSGYWDKMESAVVGVSDTPCTGTQCSGQICGKPFRAPGYKNMVNPKELYQPFTPGDFVSVPKALENVINIDCAGKTGKYVYVQLPGNGRVLALDSFNVARHRPAKADENKFLCYGVQARDANTTDDDHFVTDDPEDAAFYSTCWIREPNLEFLPRESAGSNNEEETFVFNGNCLTCENFDKNRVLDVADGPTFDPAGWEFTEECKKCSTKGPPAVPPVDKPSEKPTDKPTIPPRG